MEPSREGGYCVGRRPDQGLRSIRSLGQYPVRVGEAEDPGHAPQARHLSPAGQGFEFHGELLGSHRGAESRRGRETFLDMGGQAAEADGGNCFVVGKGELITHPPAGVTCGITHQVVVEVGAELGIPVLEENLNTRHVHAADQAPLSSTCGGMVLVESIDGNRMRTRAPGPVTTELQREYRRIITC